MASFLFALALCVASALAKYLMETYDVAEVFNPKIGENARTAWGHEVHSILKRVWRLSIVFLLFTVIDRMWMPWLNIKEVALGWGKWDNISPTVRAAVAAGWFLTLFGFLLSFSSGI